MRDKEVESLIKKEESRQKRVVNLIASENIVSDDVREALGSVFVNKYAEGYPGKRYYGGNEVSDEVERLAQARALALFGLSPDEWSVNVQPLSGSPANLAVYLALVPPGEKIMGMELAHGGHLTHGHKVSASGIFWKQIPYGVSSDTETLDYDAIEEIAKKEKPALIVAGFTAYPRAIDFKKFRKIADSCGAYLMVDMSHFAGLVAGGAHPSPFPYADVVTTTTHKSLRGPRSAIIFSRKSQITNHKEIQNSKFKIQNSKLSIADAIDKAVFPGLQGGPHLNQIAAVAVALKEAAEPSFKKYAAQVVKNAQVLAEALQEKGWRVVSGGTDTHLLLVDIWMRGEGIGGKEASERLEKEGIIVNKNTIPFDMRSPMDPSGIRLGTPAETTRGAKEKDMREIAERIDTALKSQGPS
ncbi:MAG: serine hydroxymethyltransferase [Parcubacteria group bacterium]|nr:serine hydroxymethyltransferase [Parcubacteria group bacterium]